jgi:gamma-glutamyltranspeptidase/glutathione hydrolase
VFLQALALLKGFDLDGMAPDGDAFVHTVVECLKLAYADREAWYGDPAFVDVPMTELLSERYNVERRRLVGDEASLELRPGAVGGRAPRLPRIEEGAHLTPAEVAAAGIGEPSVAELGAVAGDTVHVDVIDRDGNMIAAMPSGAWLQSTPTIPGLGFCLSARGQMLWLEEGLPSSLEPGKRPRTTLSPGLAFRDGEPWLVFGSPGGDSQDQWALTFFLRHVHHGLGIQAAIARPNFKSSHWPDSFYPRRASPGELGIESDFPKQTVEGLRRRGHKVSLVAPRTYGRMCACEKDGPLLKAGANVSTMQGYAVGR